jgi:hypothetical protein
MVIARTVKLSSFKNLHLAEAAAAAADKSSL